MVSGRSRLPHRPEPSYHHPLPRARGRRRCQPCLPVGRARADDDRPDDAPGPLDVAADFAGTDAGGRLATVRRRHRPSLLAGDPRHHARGLRSIRSPDTRRPRDPPRSGRLHPALDRHRWPGTAGPGRR